MRRRIFTVGGTVQAGSGTYLQRAVDDELLDHCRAGRIAYVLTARQMGKSSLMVHTAERLQGEGAATVIIDLSQIGANVSRDSWYVGLLTVIESRLALEGDAYAWWLAHEGVGPTQRLVQFFREVVLATFSQRIVVFIDEIDTTLSLDFTDDFFAALRAMYNIRSVEPSFERLSFVLIGVATPGDLISDPQRTPFNIGQGVDVGYFTMDEAAPLARGFDLPSAEARRVLSWILEWTEGHPFLTQRLCTVIADGVPGHVTKSDVDRAVRETFVGDRSEKDANLRFVQDMLTRRTPDPEAVLEVYRSIVRSGSVADDRKSPVVSHLKLSGIVRLEGRQLVVANRIYAHAFDRRWLREHLPRHWIRSVPPAVRGLVAASFIAVIATASFIFARLEADRAYREQARSEASADSLHLANLEAVRARQQADSLKAVADLVNAELASALAAEKDGRDLLALANDRLQESVANEQSIRQSLETTVYELEATVSENDALNRQLSAALAHERSAARAMRVLVVSTESGRLAARGDAELAGLLARRAYLLADSTAGAFGDVVLAALRDALNALTADTHEPRSVWASTGSPAAIAVDPAGRYLLAGSDDGTLRRWFMDDSLRETHRVDAHAGQIRAVLGLHGRYDAATGGADGRVIAWTLGEGREAAATPVGTVPGQVAALASAGSGRLIAAAGDGGEVLIWDLDSPGGSPLRPVATGTRIRTIALDSRGERAAWAGDDGIVRIWKLSDRPDAVVELRTDLGVINSVIFRPARDELAIAGTHPRIVLWSVAGDRSSWTVRSGLVGHSSGIVSLAFDGSGERLFSGSTDGRVLLWDVVRPASDPTLVETGERQVTAVAATADGLSLVTTGSDRRVNVWSLDFEALSDRICSYIRRPELSHAEWDEYLGSDRAYLEGGPTCPRRPRPVIADSPRNAP